MGRGLSVVFQYNLFIKDQHHVPIQENYQHIKKNNKPRRHEGHEGKKKRTEA